MMAPAISVVPRFSAARARPCKDRVKNKASSEPLMGSLAAWFGVLVCGGLVLKTTAQAFAREPRLPLEVTGLSPRLRYPLRGTPTSRAQV